MSIPPTIVRPCQSHRPLIEFSVSLFWELSFEILSPFLQSVNEVVVRWLQKAVKDFLVKCRDSFYHFHCVTRSFVFTGVWRARALETLSWPSSTLHIVPCRLPSVYINSDQLFSIYINVNRVCKIIVYYGNSLNQKIYISTRHIRWVLQCNDNLYSSGDVEKKILYLIPVLSAVTAYKVFYL